MGKVSWRWFTEVVVGGDRIQFRSPTPLITALNGQNRYVQRLSTLPSAPITRNPRTSSPPAPLGPPGPKNRDLTTITRPSILSRRTGQPSCPGPGRALAGCSPASLFKPWAFCSFVLLPGTLTPSLDPLRTHNPRVCEPSYP